MVASIAIKSAGNCSLRLTHSVFNVFLASGQKLQVLVPKNEIAAGSFIPAHCAPCTPFELPPPLPSIPLDYPEQPVSYMEEWAMTAAIVYRFGGRIIYQQISDEEVQATMELPPLWRQ